MKAVILAGGLGTRLSEETESRPKPMVEIGGKPILWHIMKIYSAHGIDEFVICCGYKGYLIKEYFANYFLHTSDVTFDIPRNRMEVHDSHCEPWRVTLVDTGQDTMTGGRLRRVREYIGDETFCFTYGDGLGDVDIAAAIAHHRRSGRLVTLTVTQPAGRFGTVMLDDVGQVASFHEKARGDGGWINAGFAVAEPAALDYVADDTVVWEQEPLELLTKDGQLAAYVHEGFWQPMDTLRDKLRLEELWRGPQRRRHDDTPDSAYRAPWQVW